MREINKETTYEYKVKEYATPIHIPIPIHTHDVIHCCYAPVVTTVDPSQSDIIENKLFPKQSLLLRL